MNKQFIEIQRHYARKGIIKTEQVDGDRKSFRIIYRSNNPQGRSVYVSYYNDKDGFVGIEAEVANFFSTKALEVVKLVNELNLWTFHVTYEFDWTEAREEPNWEFNEDFFIIQVRAAIPKSISVDEVGKVADELTELIKSAVRENYSKFEALKTMPTNAHPPSPKSTSAPTSETTPSPTLEIRPASPPPQKPIHTPEKTQPEDDDWLFDVTKF